MSGGLSRRQMQQAAEELESLSKALSEREGLGQLGEALAKMSSTLANMSQSGMTAEQAERLGQELSQASQMADLSLSDLQSIQDKLDMLGKACSACKGANAGMLGESGDYELLYSEGEALGFGPGMGGPGRGMGGKAEMGEPPVDFVDAGLGGALNTKAPMLVSVTVRGEGESEEMLKTEYTEVLPRFLQDEEEALEKEEIPPAYKDYIRRYFEDLKKR